ncbi:hypothetical protein LINPERPRIM_LOCUS38113 [Linum perenne]
MVKISYLFISKSEESWVQLLRNKYIRDEEEGFVGTLYQGKVYCLERDDGRLPN